MTIQTSDTRDVSLAVTDPPKPATGEQRTAEVQDTVDPFDYAETIVRDLALHVGSRLRDFRTDLAALHGSVAQLPETLKIGVLGQSLQELRERLAHLTGVVSQQVSRYPEELERVARNVGDLTNRVAGLESWIAAARQSIAQGDQPNLPLPSGGLVGYDQFDKVIAQVHESIMRVVAAVRDLQLDLRDLRSDVRGQPAVSIPARVVEEEPRPDPLADLNRINERLADLDAKVTDGRGRRAQTEQLASLVFGAWGRLSQPAGAEALRQTTEQVLGFITTRVAHMVRAPQVPKGSGIVAVGSGDGPSASVVVLLATEDLCGRVWQMAAAGTELRSNDADAATVRTPCWRALLSAAGLVEQAQPGAVVVPVLVYGHGMLDQLPGRDAVAAFGQSVGAVAAAGRLVSIGAPGLSLPGLGTPDDLRQALAGL